MSPQETTKDKLHEAAAKAGAIGWVVFAVCVVLFLVAAAVNLWLGKKPDSEQPESTGMTFLLFLIPLLAQGLGLYRLFVRHEKRSPTFFRFYVLTMAASLLTFIGCWLAYGISSEASKWAQWLTLGLIGFPTTLSLIMTWAIIRQGVLGSGDDSYRTPTSSADGDKGPMTGRLLDLSKLCTNLSSAVTEEKPVALLFFFAVFLSVSYLFAFTFAFHDRSQEAGKRALFMKNVDKGGEAKQEGGERGISSAQGNGGGAASPAKEKFKIDELSLICLTLRGLSGEAREKVRQLKVRGDQTEKDFEILLADTLDGNKRDDKLLAALLEEARPRTKFVFQFESNGAHVALEGNYDIAIDGTRDDLRTKKDLRTDNHKMMRAVVKRVTEPGLKNAQIRISIEGHADEDPTVGSAYQSNYELAEARAENVKIAIVNELTKGKGIPWQQIQWRCSSSSNEPEVVPLKDEIESPTESKVKVKTKAKVTKAREKFKTTDKVEMRYNEPIGRFVRVDVETFDDPVSDFKPMTLIDYVYFANYTITTTGYGDIIPNTAFAKFVCSLANIFEVFFLVVFLSAVLSVKPRGNVNRPLEGQEPPAVAGQNTGSNSAVV